MEGPLVFSLSLLIPGPILFLSVKTRATPGKKVTTLSSQSLRLVAHVSNKVDYWSGGEEAVRPHLGDSPAGPSHAQTDDHHHLHQETATIGGPVTVACRGFGEGAPWVVAVRDDDGAQILMAMETVLDSTLTGAMQQARKLCDAAIPFLLQHI